MNRRDFVVTCAATALLVMQGRLAAETDKEEQVFGWQLMTAEERKAHRAKMRALKTEAEREAFRREHHERMLARAKERGVTLPEEPMSGRGAAGKGGPRP